MHIFMQPFRFPAARVARARSHGEPACSLVSAFRGSSAGGCFSGAEPSEAAAVLHELQGVVRRGAFGTLHRVASEGHPAHQGDFSPGLDDGGASDHGLSPYPFRFG